jgi:hypothetical protein
MSGAAKPKWVKILYALTLFAIAIKMIAGVL